MKHVWVVSCVVALALACGEKERAPAVPRPTGDSGAPIDDVDAGPAAERGPVIRFMAPEVAEQPSDAAVITERMVTVRCEIKRRPGVRAAVDEDSIEIWLEKPREGNPPERVRPAVTHLDDDQYEASFDVSDMPNGPITFTCTAKDDASSPQTNTQTLTTLLDLGPRIKVETPEDGATKALRQPVSVEFKVEAAPLTEGDENAAVEEVTLQVSGLDIALTESEETEGLYKASIDFNDRSLFAVAPSASEVLITAKNKRNATRSVKRDIVLDGDGPTITVMSPVAGAIVHGEIRFRVVASDPAGLADDTLEAVFKGVIKDADLVVNNWRPATEGGGVEQLVDTVAFDDDLNQVTIQISARDRVNNITTIFHTLRLDNMPPVLSMDPPNMIEWRKSDTKYFCSREFDPLGDDAANDGKPVPPSAMFRVFVEDRTNESFGDKAPTYAGVATDKVELYAQGETATPLLIDQDGDGTCDEINNNPSANKPTKLGLRPLTPSGSAWYTKAPEFSLNIYDEKSELTQCTHDPNGADPAKGSPTPFCGNTSMFRTIPGRGEDKPAAIYAFNPTGGSALNCQGEVWMVEPFVGTGWACLAARAEDKIGNVGISPPLRVCVMSGPNDTTTPCLPGNPEENNPPSCLGNCTMSAAQQVPALVRQAR